MCKCVLFFDQIYVNYANGGGEKNTAISLYGLAAECLLLNFLDMDGRDFSKMRYCLWGRKIGYDFFSLSQVLRDKRQQFYLFARYDIYDAQAKINASRNYWAGRQKVSCGFNYFPIPQIVVKGEFGYGILNQNPHSETNYNNEPYIALSINYSGFFEL